MKDIRKKFVNVQNVNFDEVQIWVCFFFIHLVKQNLYYSRIEFAITAKHTSFGYILYTE